MAEKNNPRDDLHFRPNEPKLSHSPAPSQGDDDFDVESSSGGLFGKIRNSPWVKKNPTLAKGVAAGALLLVLLLVVGWQLGWFGGANTAGGVAAPPPLLTPPMPTAASLPNPEQQANPAETKPEAEAKKEEVAKVEIPPLPDDVTKWKKEDYFRARKENDPKLLEAVAFLGEKFHGSDPAAQGLTELLKPLPPDEPKTSEATSPAPGQAPPMPGQTSSMPGQAPPMPGQTSSMPGQAPPMPGPMGPGPMGPGPGPMGMMPPGPMAPGPSMHGQTSPTRQVNQAEVSKLVEAIVAALGQNGSDTARQTLEQILSGKLTTDDDKVAVEATLKALVAYPCRENDVLLFRMLMTPETVRPADHEGPWSARELQTKTFELVKLGASPDLRAKLADSLAEQISKLAPNDPIGEFLLKPDPRNAIAQSVLYEKGSSVKELRLQLEQQLAGYSALALGRLLAISEGTGTSAGGFDRAAVAGARPMAGPMPGPMAGPMAGLMAGSPAGSTSDPAAEAAAKHDSMLGPRLADLLWSEKFRTLVDTPLAEMKSLDRQTNLILLAATIPQDSTRVALAKLFRKRSTDSPKLLESAGLFDRMITDPGFLVLVKLLPRKDYKAKAGKQPQQPARQPMGAAAGKMAEVAKANQRKEQAEQDWLNASQKLVVASLERFRGAALANEDKGTVNADKPNADAAAPVLPPDLQLGEEAKPVASYHVLWPDNVAKTLSGEKPSFLEIYYVRAEEQNTPKKAVGFYARQLQTRLTDARPIDSRAIWIDGMRLDSSAGRRRSMDVWITRAAGEGGDAVRDEVKDDDQTDLIVEMLVIDIKDPVTRQN